MTEPSPGEAFPHQINFAITPEIETGVYANFASVWHQQDSFILDFAVFTRPPEFVEDGEGRKIARLPARVVSRVRIHPDQVFELMKALENQLSAWEFETGKRKPDTDS
jgi:hypothetical protein